MTINAIGVLSQIMVEDFPTTVEDLIPWGTDPILNDVLLTGREVKRVGRPNAPSVNTNLWEATHKMRIAPGGVLTWAGIERADVNETGDLSGRFLNTGASFPSALYATQSQYLEMGIPVAMCMGNVATNTMTLKSLKLAEHIYDHVEGMIKDQIRVLRSHLQFSAYGDGTGAIGVVGDVGTQTNIGAAGESTTITLSSSNGAIRGFVRNMLLDVYDTTGATKRNTGGPLLVNYVDYQTNTIKVTLTQDQNKVNNAVPDIAMAATDVIYLWNSKGNMPYGLDYFTKNSGTIFKCNLANYPELKSKISGNSGTLRAPTEEVINLFLDSWADNGFGEFPELMVSSRGVRSRFVKTQMDRNFHPIAPSQGDVVYDGGFKGTKYTYENKELKWFVSPHVNRKNSIHFINRKDFRLYAPEGVNKIEWFYNGGGVSGANSIWSPVYNLDTTNSITQTSQLLEAPYSFFIQFATTSPQNLGRLDDLEALSDAV